MKKECFSLVNPVLPEILGPHEYVSLSAALLLNGYRLRDSETIFVISPRKRRNKTVNGSKIVFLFRHKSVIDELIKFTVELDGIRVAMPFLAWLDMLDRLRHAPDCKGLAKLAQKIPFKTRTFLDTAAKISNAVFKRACFFMVSCGRIKSIASCSDSFASTPVYLDPRVSKGEMLWEKKLKLFYPEKFLTFRIDESIKKRFDLSFFLTSAAVQRAWRETSPLVHGYERDCAEFCDLAFPVSPLKFQMLKRWLKERRFHEISSDLGSEDLKHIAQWVKFLFPGPEQEESFLQSIRAAGERLKADVSTTQQVLILALALNSHSLIAGILENLAAKIWVHGETNLLVLAAKCGATSYLKEKDAVAAIVLAMVGSGRFAESLKIFNEAGLAKGRSGLCLFCQAEIKIQIEKDPKAGRLFDKAIEYFHNHAQKELLALARIALGNFYLRLRMYADAGCEYERVLSAQDAVKIPKSLLVIVTGNMGIARFCSGQHKEAIELLQKALPQCRKTSFSSSYPLFKYYLALNYFMVGRVVDALVTAEEAWEVMEKTQNSVLKAHLAGLSAFLNVFLGREIQINNWNFFIENDEKLSETEGIFFEIARLFFAGKFSEAESICQTNEMIFYDLSAISILRLHAMTIAMVAKLKNKSFRRSLWFKKTFHSPGASWFHESFYGRMIEALCISDVGRKESRIALLLCESISSQRFDPLWFLFADLLPESEAKLAAYLSFQFQISPELVKIVALKYLEKNRNFAGLLKSVPGRTEKFYLTVSEDEITRISFSEYLLLRAGAEKEQTFFYDEPRSEILLLPFKVKFRKSHMTIRLLSFLLQNSKRGVTVASAYESVWGSSFDEDADLDSFNSTAKRLNAFFRKNSLPLRLKFSSASPEKPLSLEMPAGWRAVFCLDS